MDKRYYEVQSMSLLDQVEFFVQKYGEEYRKMIAPALKWLEEQEPKWDLDKPIGRMSYIAGLVGSAKDA